MSVQWTDNPFFGKMFTKSTDKNRVGPPPIQQHIAYLINYEIPEHDMDCLRRSSGSCYARKVFETLTFATWLYTMHVLT